jgi:hypothetical protein
LRNGGNISRNVADLLDYVGRRNSPPVRFHFSRISGGGITLGYLIGLGADMLDNKLDDDHIANVSLLAHEIWHIPQGFERVSTWGEIESYSLESLVYTELSGKIDLGLRQFEQFRQTDGTVSRDLCTLCAARKKLLVYSNYLWLYDHEPVLRFRVGEIPNYPHLRDDIYVAEDCKYCSTHETA